MVILTFSSNDYISLSILNLTLFIFIFNIFIYWVASNVTLLGLLRFIQPLFSHWIFAVFHLLISLTESLDQAPQRNIHFKISSKTSWSLAFMFISSVRKCSLLKCNY